MVLFIRRDLPKVNTYQMLATIEDIANNSD